MRMWAFAFKVGPMHYFVYLDEFGHIGPFVSKHDQRYHSSPVFGFSGIALPVNEVRNFSTFFYELKSQLLSFEIHRDGADDSKWKWEKKGSALYTVENVEKYFDLRVATNRIVNKIKFLKGFVFYAGIKKDVPSSAPKPDDLYVSVLRDVIRKLDAHFMKTDSTFSIFLDAVDSNESGDKRKFRMAAIKVATAEMFGSDPKPSLLEPPYQLESHLYQNLQCADWFCGIFNRIFCFRVSRTDYADCACFIKYFGRRLKTVIKTSIFHRRYYNTMTGRQVQ